LVLAIASGCDVTAVHVDHGLRSGSHREAEVVERMATKFGAAFERRRVTVEPGPNLEGRARSARYDALPDGVLTGHTADDQAETVLMFLMRGTGPEGLAGIDPLSRPILGLRRSETVALCEVLAIDVVNDPTNLDPRFTRNRVRAELLPLMNDIARRDVAPLIARTAALQREALGALEAEAARLDPTDAKALALAEPALASLAIRRWWRDQTDLDHAPDRGAMDRIMAVARGSATSTDVVAGWRVARTANRLRLQAPPDDRSAFSGPDEVR